MESMPFPIPSACAKVKIAMSDLFRARSLGLPVALFAVLSFTLPNPALLAQCSPAAGSAPASAWPRVVLNVFALDPAGNPVTPSPTARFQVLQDGTAQTVQEVAGSGAPMTLALVLDSSGSDFDWHSQAVSAAQSLIDSLPAGSEVAVVVFSDHAYCDFPLAPLSSFTPRAFEHMESSGPSAVYDALVATEMYIASRAHNPRRAIVLISDGADNDSTITLQQTIDRLLVDGAPALYLLAPTPSHGHTSREESYRARRAMELLARYTGGLVFPAKRPEDIPAAAARIRAILRSQVALIYSSTTAAADGQMHRLDVHLDTRDVSIRGLPGFYAPKPLKSVP